MQQKGERLSTRTSMVVAAAATGGADTAAELGADLQKESECVYTKRKLWNLI